jgi:hypothetical protein
MSEVSDVVPLEVSLVPLEVIAQTLLIAHTNLSIQSEGGLPWL